MSLASYRTTISEGGAPVSLEAERRKTMTIVHRVEKDVVAFREKYLKKAAPQFPDDMHEFIQFVVERNFTKKYPKTTTEFIVMLNKVRDSAEVTYKSEVDMFESAMVLYNAFKGAMGTFMRKLTDAREQHVGKYCHSFSAEMGMHEIPSVQFYENNITNWRGQIREAFTLLDDIQRNIKESTNHLDLFFLNFSRVVHYMGLSLDVFPRIFTALKDWVTADEAYVRRLQDDMYQLKREKVNIDNLARRHKLAAGGIQSKVTRSKHHTKTLKEKLTRARDDRRQCRKRELSMLELSSKISTDLKMKTSNLDIALQQLHNKDDHTKSARDRLVDTSGELSKDIAKLEKKISNLKSGLRNLKMERLTAQKEFHKLQVLYEKNSKLQNDIQDDAHDASQDARDLDEERRILGEKVMALARIRAIKTDPQTVKIIYSEGYTPGRKFEVPETLEEACRVAATGVGRDWPQNNLSPRRDVPFQNTQGPHAGSPRIDAKNRGAGYGSLDRWSKLTQEASVNVLSRTLRSMKEQEGADKVEKKIITVN